MKPLSLKKLTMKNTKHEVDDNAKDKQIHDNANDADKDCVINNKFSDTF